MPGQPAWTLTEMLECNLPLCWAGGGDCNVGPAQCFLAAHFFPLKPIRATTCSSFKLKLVEPGSVFLESRKLRRLKRRREGRVFWSRKQGVLGVFLGAENQ